MLQYVITVHDRQKLKLTPAMLSLAEKKNAQVLSCFLIPSLSPSFLFLWEIVCLSKCLCAGNSVRALAFPLVPCTGFAYKQATYFSQLWMK